MLLLVADGQHGWRDEEGRSWRQKGMARTCTCAGCEYIECRPAGEGSDQCDKVHGSVSQRGNAMYQTDMYSSSRVSFALHLTSTLTFISLD